MLYPKEALFKPDPEAPMAARCFFCYGLFEEEQLYCQYDEQKIYHLGCLKFMLIANEIEGIHLKKHDGSEAHISGFSPKYPRPY